MGLRREIINGTRGATGMGEQDVRGAVLILSKEPLYRVQKSRPWYIQVHTGYVPYLGYIPVFERESSRGGAKLAGKGSRSYI